MAKACITIPGGVSVEIDGTPEEISSVLEKVRSEQRIGGSASPTRGKSRGEISGLVDSLKAEQFFKTPRGLSDVQGKLADLGHHYPLTTLSGAMQSQSRRRNLRRFKRDGKYVYVQ